MIKSWCLVLIDGRQIMVNIRHKGRGRFEIIEDADNGRYVGKIVDASDVVKCEI